MFEFDEDRYVENLRERLEYPSCPHIECDCCDGEIYEDDDYYEIDGVKYCEDCIADFKTCYSA